MNYEAIGSQFESIFGDVAPGDANAYIVTTTGGTVNAYGEIEGAAEVETPVKLLIVGQKKSSKVTGAGDTTPIESEFMAMGSALISSGDRVRFDGIDYNVESVEVLLSTPLAIFMSGIMVKIHGN